MQLLTDAVSDTSVWEELGSEVTVRRLDSARTSQLHNTSELMLFRHIMELELLEELVGSYLVLHVYILHIYILVLYILK
jgi:hypothetical protein